jgi:hypothetical protein
VNTSSSARGNNLRLFNTDNTLSSGPGLYFHADVTTTQQMAKGAILFERTTNWGRGSLNFAVNNTAAYGDATLADTKMTITADGNIGIGTTSPTGKLNVEGAATGKALTILNETGDQDILAASASGTTRFRLANTGYLYAERYIDMSNSLYYLDPANTGNSLTTAGNVGVGTDSPTALFQISDRWQGTTSNFGSTNASGAQLQYTGGITTPIFTFNGDTDTGIGRGGSNILNFMTGGAERMRIATDGNVGIGTTDTTNAKAEIFGTGFRQLIVQSDPATSTQAGGMYIYNNAGEALAIEVTDDTEAQNPSAAILYPRDGLTKLQQTHTLLLMLEILK